MKTNLAIILFPLAMCFGCSSPPLMSPAAEYVNEIVLNDSQLEGLARAKADNGDDFTYAVSTSGHWGYFSGTGERGIVGALGVCQRYANQPCRVYTSGSTFTQNRYAEFAAESRAALRSLKNIPDKNYYDEATDWKIVAPPLARAEMVDMNGLTPIALPGIRTIRTAELVELIKQAKPIVIDAEGYRDDHQAIPNAFLINWLGVPRMSANEEVAVSNRIDMVMRNVAKDKTQPVVVSCESSRCWLSVFAALRLRELGYNNLLWYRGGRFAWKEAGLPLVKPVPYATVWDYDIHWPK